MSMTRMEENRGGSPPANGPRVLSAFPGRERKFTFTGSTVEVPCRDSNPKVGASVVDEVLVAVSHLQDPFAYASSSIFHVAVSKAEVVQSPPAMAAKSSHHRVRGLPG